MNTIDPSQVPETLPDRLRPSPAGRRLHLGGEEQVRPWEIFNVVDRPGVDHVGNILDLSRFEDGTFSSVYASHVLEHVALAAVVPTLKAIGRILEPGGRLYVSVPDAIVLTRIFGHSKTPSDIRMMAMRMLFGGQMDPWDFHYVGFWEELLRESLTMSGFSEALRVRRFDLFSDTSDLELAGHLVSLNVVATK